MQIQATGLGSIMAERGKSGPNILLTITSNDPAPQFTVCEISREEFARFCAAGGALVL